MIKPNDRAMNVLVILNERPMGSHRDVYEALRQLATDGFIRHWTVYPYAQRLAEGTSCETVSREIVAAAAQLQADTIVWMHTMRLAISADTIRTLRALPAQPAMAYWEKDSYHPSYKPLPAEMLSLMRACDAVFLPCGGPVIDVLAGAGCTAVRFAPSCASGERFPHIWEPQRSPTFDVVMIGNHVVSRRPGRTMPGARQRARLARALEKRYGARFGLFGSGWRGRSAQGPCAFDDQSPIYADAAVAVGVNNSTWPFVFSNRLPIALATGIPLVYNANPGFDRIFGEELDDMFFHDEAGALSRIERLLSRDPEALRERSARHRAFFERSLTQRAVCRYVLEQTHALRNGPPAGGPPELPGEGSAAARWMRLPLLSATPS